ncbi:MAG: fumarylacetoacetate hydrolase family protein [Rubrivivax sp.]|jgi:fumarylpyruvate hydrolase|nr:fumarylacetoacetate hydrolase family protein [Rubrivivax sp.]
MSLVFPAPPRVVLPVVGGGAFPVRRVYCVGRNYAEHAREMGASGREPPFFFMKPADALCPADAAGAVRTAYPSLTSELHHEVELVVAIGRAGSDIAAGEAAAFVWGHAVGLDMTRRDLQARMKAEGRPWDIGKAFDESAPIGALVPAGADGPLRAGAITLAVNGTPRQRGDLSAMIWGIEETLVHLSRAWALAPGDLVFTGTPAGVGAVQRGDVIEAAVEGLPPLRVEIA